MKVKLLKRLRKRFYILETCMDFYSLEAKVIFVIIDTKFIDDISVSSTDLEANLILRELIQDEVNMIRMKVEIYKFWSNK